jgi:hypothetical protein
MASIFLLHSSWLFTWITSRNRDEDEVGMTPYPMPLTWPDRGPPSTYVIMEASSVLSSCFHLIHT